MSFRKSGAEISLCQNYRYNLWRQWTDNPDCGTCVFIGLNPSTADNIEDDPTIRRCIQYAKDWGCGRLVMLNLFAYRATDPAVMKQQARPVGSLNDYNLRFHTIGAQIVVAAWGNHGSHRGRYKEALTAIDEHVDLKCFKVTKAGQPIHPLYQRRDAKLIDYRPEATS